MHVALAERPVLPFEVERLGTLVKELVRRQSWHLRRQPRSVVGNEADQYAT